MIPGLGSFCTWQIIACRVSLQMWTDAPVACTTETPSESLRRFASTDVKNDGGRACASPLTVFSLHLSKTPYKEETLR